MPEVDRFGNTRGGVRVLQLQLDVPTARYLRKIGTDGQLLPAWHRVPFDEAEFKSYTKPGRTISNSSRIA
jgi:hypothetical protein